MQAFILALFLLVSAVSAFKTVPIKARAPRVGPVHENFFLDIAEDPAVNTPKEIFGEVAYKNFADETVPNNLMTGNYDAITRIRQLKLLTLTVESGLLEALEEKGLTLSQVEKLLPVADDLGLLPLLVENKDLALSVAPLLIEPAPALLPLLVKIIKTPSTTFSAAGAALVGLGGFETFNDAGLIGVPLALLGAPLLVLGSVLSSVFSGSISIPSSSSKAAPGGTRRRKVVKVN